MGTGPGWDSYQDFPDKFDTNAELLAECYYNTEGDDEPGGVFVAELDLQIAGPHPGFFVDPSEACEDGNTEGDDACSADCSRIGYPLAYYDMEEGTGDTIAMSIVTSRTRIRRGAGCGIRTSAGC